MKGRVNLVKKGEILPEKGRKQKHIRETRKMILSENMIENNVNSVNRELFTSQEGAVAKS